MRQQDADTTNAAVSESKNGPPEPLYGPRIWCPLKISPPKREEICPDDRSIVTQTLTPIGALHCISAAYAVVQCPSVWLGVRHVRALCRNE